MQCAKAKCTVTNFKSMFKVHQFAVNDSFVSKNCPHSCQESKSLKVSLRLWSSMLRIDFISRICYSFCLE